MKVYSNKPKWLNLDMFDLALKKTENEVGCLSVGVKFVSSYRIKRLNKVHRSVAKVTDVLSFPLLEVKRKNSLSEFECERDPLTKELELGDIAICSARARKQAREFGHSFEREVNFLALHGFLHLLGYDHMTKKDEKQMNALADEILCEVGIIRESKANEACGNGGKAVRRTHV